MLASFDRCVGAIAEVVARRELGAPTDSQVDDVARFLREVLRQMPDYLRIAFRILTIVFDASALVFHAKPFHRLPLGARARLVDAWSRTAVPFAPSFIAFFVTFGTFCISSDLHGGEDAAAVR